MIRAAAITEMLFAKVCKGQIMRVINGGLRRVNHGPAALQPAVA
jgi:hypothetical protein